MRTEAGGDHVYFVAALQEVSAELIRPLFDTAASRIEVIEDQSDSHL